MQLLPELCINTRGSKLPLWVNPSPNAAPKAPTSSVVSPGWDGGAQPAAPDRAPVEEDDEGDADGVALLADADGLQDPRVPQLGPDHVSLKEPWFLGWGWGEPSATAWADPHPPCAHTLPVPAGQGAQAPAALTFLLLGLMQRTKNGLHL